MSEEVKRVGETSPTAEAPSQEESSSVTETPSEVEALEKPSGLVQREVLRVNCEKHGAVDRSAQDDFIVEERGLRIFAGGRDIAVVMRTPGKELELVRGLLRSEGIERGEESWEINRRGADEYEVCVPLELLEERHAERASISNASCGVCGGQSLAALEEIASANFSELSVSSSSVLAILDRLRANQPIFARTGASHGAALFSSTGSLRVLREDVGRHNAVDKVCGWLRNDERGKDLAANSLLCVSGRVSYEIVHKAAVAKLPIVIAVSAPSSLAVDLAERWRITLLAFARNSGFNLYSHGFRVH